MPINKVPEKKKLRGICTGFIYNEDGIIEISLKHITIFTCAVLSISLFIMLYLACTDDKWWVVAGERQYKRKCHFEQGNY